METALQRVLQFALVLVVHGDTDRKLWVFFSYTTSGTYF